MDSREVALERYRAIEPFLQKRTSLEEISRQKGIAVRTLYNWVSAFKENGLNGLTPKIRNDKGKHRAATEEISELVQGLYLRCPPSTVSSIFRIVKEVCQKNGWRVPSYDVINKIVSEIPANLKTLAHDGVKAYQQSFGLIQRFEAERPNEIWQADHTLLDILVFDARNQAMKPWLTVIIDDYSRAIAGYFLGLQPPSAMRIALALRQAIWRKDDPDWNVCGIPEKFYSDRGSDFMSNHIDQVAIDLKFETIQTEPGEPQGKGKCERFFGTVNEMLISTLPGYCPKGHESTACLTVEQLEERFKLWLLNEYMTRTHSEISASPKDRWESFAFLPRLPDSLEQLDLLLLTVTRTRVVRRDGIRFSGFRYFDVSLNGYVGEEVTVRFDPRDLGHIYVYLDNVLICKASCFELTGKKVSLKEVKQARNHETKVQKKKLEELLAIADKHAPPPRHELPAEPTVLVVEHPKLKIRRFACDLD